MCILSLSHTGSVLFLNSGETLLRFLLRYEGKKIIIMLLLLLLYYFFNNCTSYNTSGRFFGGAPVKDIVLYVILCDVPTNRQQQQRCVFRDIQPRMYPCNPPDHHTAMATVRRIREAEFILLRWHPPRRFRHHQILICLKLQNTPGSTALSRRHTNI